MKIRGWILAVAMVVSAQCAFASDASDIASGGSNLDGTFTPGDQQYLVDQFVLAGADAEFAQTQIINSSRGTFLNGLYDAMTDGNVDSGVKSAVEDLWESATGVGGPANEGDMQILNGTFATAGAEAASATTMAIGGGGGVIAGRQSGLMAERKAMGNVDSAMASFRMNQSFANRIWASPFYTKQNMDKKDGYDGYDYSAWGASVGYDHVFGPLVLGGAFTYSRGDFDADNINDDNTIDNYGFSLYGQYYCVENGFFATISGGYNYGDNEWRNIDGLAQRHSGENETDSFWFGANVGKDFFLGENWTVTPSVGLFWSDSESSAYTSQIDGALDFQNFSEISSESLMMPIDLKVEYTTLLDECSSLSFSVNGGYAYNWKNDGGRAEGSFQYAGTDTTVFIQGVTPGRSSWNLGAGLTYRRNNFDIGVNYRYDGRSKFDGHRVAATIGWNF